MSLNPKISEIVSNLKPDTISKERKQKLQVFIDFLQTKTDKNEAIRLNFICTHNSRRSHLTQIWAQTLAHHFKLKNVACYSGGTEATAVYKSVIKSLEIQGFQIKKLSEVTNSVYQIKYDADQAAIIAFSKKYNDDFNPKSNFAAVMTCSDADQNCPLVLGAEARIPFTFEDPKVSDNTPKELEKYQEKSLEIATELFYIFSEIKY